MMQLLLAVILSNLSKITQLETFNSINKKQEKVEEDIKEQKNEEIQRRKSIIIPDVLNADGTPNHFAKLMLAIKAKKEE